LPHVNDNAFVSKNGQQASIAQLTMACA
jgi:hypothetical protein